MHHNNTVSVTGVILMIALVVVIVHRFKDDGKIKAHAPAGQAPVSLSEDYAARFDEAVPYTLSLQPLSVSAPSILDVEFMDALSVGPLLEG